MVNNGHPGKYGDPLVEMRDLSNRFGAEIVHEKLDLDIKRREILRVVGGSGSGKSVLLRSLVGLHALNVGSVSTFGWNLAKLSPAERMPVRELMGILFQRGVLSSSACWTTSRCRPSNIQHCGPLPSSLRAPSPRSSACRTMQRTRRLRHCAAA
ncbi:ATP-binding cassette domain-containing protein [Caballeronia sp. LjRoot34]|uniref:ATP-binding cassette domain-containing protein n=1 Tax=Caballeronia sp. LjRoot34 TaxID=3342325 RepID=UPI003ECF831F